MAILSHLSIKALEKIVDKTMGTQNRVEYSREYSIKYWGLHKIVHEIQALIYCI